MTGFEPATPSSRTKYATGLRYIPPTSGKINVFIGLNQKTDLPKFNRFLCDQNRFGWHGVVVGRKRLGGQGFKSSRVQGFKGSRVQEFNGSMDQWISKGFKGSRVQMFKRSRAQPRKLSGQGFKSSSVQTFECHCFSMI